jgi:hypothetical protein
VKVVDATGPEDVVSARLRETVDDWIARGGEVS